MALAALIAAYHESSEPGVLRATLPLAGRTVIERQARLAAAAGAAAIVVLVERLPVGLTSALDRLRREGVPVKVARSAEEAAESIPPGDRLLLVADGAVADLSQLARLANGDGPAVLTVPDGVFGEPYERIDAGSRWAGVASVDGSMLRDTASTLGDWDLQSTLLRRALQAGARPLAADGPVAILDAPSDLAGLERQIVASADAPRGSWASRLLAPIERMATHALMAGPVRPGLLGTAAAVMAGAGAVSLGYGWLWPGLLLLLAATPLDGIAERLAQIRMQEEKGAGWWASLLPVLAGAALVALSYALAAAFGWGMILLGFTTLGFLFALAVETEGRELRGGILLADRKGLIWLMLPFAIFGAWHAGLAALFAYAAASFFWAQRQVHAPVR